MRFTCFVPYSKLTTQAARTFPYRIGRVPHAGTAASQPPTMIDLIAMVAITTYAVTASIRANIVADLVARPALVAARSVTTIVAASA